MNLVDYSTPTTVLILSTEESCMIHIQPNTSEFNWWNLSTGMSPLHLAVEGNHALVIRLLAAHKADITIKVHYYTGITQINTLTVNVRSGFSLWSHMPKGPEGAPTKVPNTFLWFIQV